MKKLIIALVALCVSSVAFAERTISFMPCKATAGSSVTAYIEIINTDYDVLGVGFSFVLPEGITINVKSDNTITKKNLGIEENSRTYDDEEEDFFAFTTFGTSGITDNGVTTYKLNAIGTKFIEGTSGAIFHAVLNVASTVAPGVYPITIKDAKLVKAAGSESIDGLVSTSYIIVGEPTGASLAITGELPSTTTTALNSETAITSLDLSAATQVNGTLDLSNKGISAYNTTATFEGVKYARTVGANNYATVCLPIAVGGTYYKVSEITAKSITLAEATDGIPAGTPAIVKGDISASAENVTLAAPADGANSLTGTYKALDDFACCYLAKNTFYNDHASIAPYRAYLPSSVIPSGVKSFNVYVEDETGIHDITDQLSNEDIYTLQGVRVKNAQKGVNIIGGKKVYNK